MSLEMPTGPKGEKRPADVIGNAVHVMRKRLGVAHAGRIGRAKMPKTYPRNFNCPETGTPCLHGECSKTRGLCRQREKQRLAEAREEFEKKQRILGAEIIESLEAISKKQNSN
jgi:hypothetical protein